MTKAIIEQHFDLEKSEDQQQLITMIIEEVIDKKVLAHVEPARLDWHKAHLLLLCIPRRFNLVIMEELLETFGTPPIRKIQSKLAQMDLPKQLNANTNILYRDMQKVGFTLDDSIRNIFFVYQRVHNFELFMKMHQYLAEKNRQITIEVGGSDSIRYFREYLYHSAQSLDTQAIEPILQTTLEQINKISSNAPFQFYNQFTRDTELQETLGKRLTNALLSMLQKYLTQEE